MLVGDSYIHITMGYEHMYSMQSQWPWIQVHRQNEMHLQDDIGMNDEI